MKMFQQKVEGALHLKTKLTADDLKILLVYLSRDKNYLAYDEQVRLNFCQPRTWRLITALDGET